MTGLRAATLGIACALWGSLAVPCARAESAWQVTAAGGGDFRFVPDVVGHGFGLVEATRSSTLGGRLRLLYNTDTLHAGLESVRLAPDLELNAFLRGEAFFAGILPDYYQRGERIAERGFLASYLHGAVSLKWHPRPYHSLELLLGVRQWFFTTARSTADSFVLPPDTFVFEPRLRYSLWRVKAGSREWQGHTLFPRVQGVALSAELGLDVRADDRAWGAPDGGGLAGRNDPSATILMVRQRLIAGAPLGGWGRLQLEQHGSWGEGEDDLTRNRVGGMNPYVVPVHGLPWAALLSERLLSGQIALHVPVDPADQHELGVAVSGGAFNDVRRVGALDQFGGAAGTGVFADLRFGRFQLHARVGYAFPVVWLTAEPSVSGFLSVGSQLK